MQPEQVDEILKNHKLNVGRCKYLEAQIQEAVRELNRGKATMLADAALHAQQYSDMPHGSSVGDPTGSLVLSFLSGHQPDMIKDLSKDLQDMTKECLARAIQIRYVEAWLDGLNERERWLIQEQVIEGRYWAEIAIEWKRKYGMAYQKDTLKKLKGRIMEKIYLIAA